MIAAIIQARMNSTRLPGKVLLPLGDTTVLGHTVRRVSQAKRVEQVVVATSTEPTDDVIAEYCQQEGITVFRGDLNDVLDRYYHAARWVSASNIVRITADCPLIDPEVIDKTIGTHLQERADYTSTGRIISTYPDGLDTEVATFDVLKRAWEEAKLPSEREHVTTYIWNHPELFRVVEVKHHENLGQVRLAVDEPTDYQVISHLVEQLKDYSMSSVIAYIRAHPEVVAQNATIARDEGYFKSLQQDEKTKNK